MSKGDRISLELVGGPPWGFRLGGGADFGCPLEIAKLRKKSKAFAAGLAEGDVVTVIDHQDVASKSHGDAMKIIELAGPTLRLEIIKGVGPSANLDSALLSESINASSGAEGILMNNSQEHRPVEAMVVKSREPSISKAYTEPARERSIPRTLTIIPSSSQTSKVDGGPAPVRASKPAEPWTVDVTLYQFANVNPTSSNTEPNQSSLAAPLPKQPPPTSPKPKFKANTLPRASAQKSSCPVIPNQGSPSVNPNPQHVFSPTLDQNGNVTAKVPPMFKVAKIDVKPQKWQPTAVKDISFDDPRHQFNTNGVMNVPQSSPISYMSQSYEQQNPMMIHSPAANTSWQIPEPPPIPTSILSPPSRKPANHIPGMVNPLICDDSQGDFGANPIVRPNTDGEQTQSKKMYSDSAFYDSPSMAYPTIQEQVAMAKEISNILESNQNKRSRGGRMFTKRKQRADEWSMNSQGRRKEVPPVASFNSLSSGMPIFSMQRKEFGYNQVRHHPDPIKSKISSAELEQIQHNQASLCKHDSLPPNLAFDINQALANSHGKAGQFFERRRQRAEKYVVDENNRKNWQPQNTNLQAQIEPPASDYTQILSRSYKSPWEAAIEGRLDSAFENLQQTPPAAYQQPQQPAGVQVHQPLNVITNQPQLGVKYKTFKPVKPGAIHSGQPLTAVQAMPKQRTRLEMMLEGSSGLSPSNSEKGQPININNQSIHSQGMSQSMQSSPAVSMSHSQMSAYSPAMPPVQAVNPSPRPMANSTFTMTSLKRPKDYMQERNKPNDYQAVSSF